MSLLDSSNFSGAGTDTTGSASSSSEDGSSPTSSVAACEEQSRSVPQCSRVSEPSARGFSSMLRPLGREGLRDELEVKSGGTRECSVCNRTLPVEVFAKVTGTRFRNPKCNTCRNKSILTQPAVRAKAALLEAAKAQPCVDCGRCFPPECMDFDHVEKGSKDYNVAAMWRWISMERLKAELAKCELVCSNCHRTRTKKRGYTGGRKSKILADLQRDVTEVRAEPRSDELTTARL